MVIRTYKYRLYPTRSQKIKLQIIFEACKHVYNELLALSIDAYKFGNVTLKRYDYNHYLCGRSIGLVHSQVLQNVGHRLHCAFQNFFGNTPDDRKRKAFPRFKSKVKSITFPQEGFSIQSGRLLRVSKIGEIPLVLHRIPKGKIKTLTIKVNKAGQWFAIFCCEIPYVTPSHPSKERIGIDVGLENIVTLSNGTKIESPWFYIKSEKRLQLLQRKVSRKIRGSENRNKARLNLAKLHLKIANQRRDFLHKTTHDLVCRYSLIAIEKLNIKGMVRDHYLSKHISDASWRLFMDLLSYKAVASGGQVVSVSARGTTNTCSKCGAHLGITLDDRSFICPACGFACDRDLNAAINIQGRAGHARTDTPVDTSPILSEMGARDVDEAGTLTTDT